MASPPLHFADREGCLLPQKRKVKKHFPLYPISPSHYKYQHFFSVNYILQRQYLNVGVHTLDYGIHGHYVCCAQYRLLRLMQPTKESILYAIRFLTKEPTVEGVVECSIWLNALKNAPQRKTPTVTIIFSLVLVDTRAF